MCACVRACVRVCVCACVFFLWSLYMVLCSFRKNIELFSFASSFPKFSILMDKYLTKFVTLFTALTKPYHLNNQQKLQLLPRSHLGFHIGQISWTIRHFRLKWGCSIVIYLRYHVKMQDHQISAQNTSSYNSCNITCLIYQ